MTTHNAALHIFYLSSLINSTPHCTSTVRSKPYLHSSCVYVLECMEIWMKYYIIITFTDVRRVSYITFPQSPAKKNDKYWNNSPCILFYRFFGFNMQSQEASGLSEKGLREIFIPHLLPLSNYVNKTGGKMQVCTKTARNRSLSSSQMTLFNLNVRTTQNTKFWVFLFVFKIRFILQKNSSIRTRLSKAVNKLIHPSPHH